MQGGSLLALRQSAQHVNKHSALTTVSLATLSRARIRCAHGQPSFPSWTTTNTRFSRHFSSAQQCQNHLLDVKEYTAANPISVWTSTSNNPYENLAVENYLLKNSDVASQILFTYVNWPCVVIGRNQNPWVECNLRRMQRGLPYHALEGENQHEHDGHPSLEDIPMDGELISLDLVRRRSGGGTVIHDAGNLNFSFIVPNDKDFTRDKHAELVVSMLEKFRSNPGMKPYYSSVRVNERHDIVMKRENPVGGANKEFKVSGSAFKLTRGRALHHGTILHTSPNIVEQSGIGPKDGSVFSEVLSSPAKPYLEAKGVGSVRSPVHNLFKAERSSDRIMYNRELRSELQSAFQSANHVRDIEVQKVGGSDCSARRNKQIFDDVQELLTKEWQFCQTPSFEYSSSHEEGVVNIHFQVKHGVVGKPCVKEKNGNAVKGYEALGKLEGRRLHEISDWTDYVSSSSPSSASVASHLAAVFPNVQLASHTRMESIQHSAVENVETKQIEQDGGRIIKQRWSDGTAESEREGENLVAER